MTHDVLLSHEDRRDVDQGQDAAPSMNGMRTDGNKPKPYRVEGSTFDLARDDLEIMPDQEAELRLMFPLGSYVTVDRPYSDYTYKIGQVTRVMSMRMIEGRNFAQSTFAGE